MTYRYFNGFLAAAKQEQHLQRISDVHALTHRLPKNHFEMLDIIILHLRKVSLKSHKNKMSIFNLGVVFGPTLLKASEDSLAAVLEIKFNNLVIEILIENYELIFKNSPGKSSDYMWVTCRWIYMFIVWRDLRLDWLTIFSKDRRQDRSSMFFSLILVHEIHHLVHPFNGHQTITVNHPKSLIHAILSQLELVIISYNLHWPFFVALFSIYSFSTWIINQRLLVYKWLQNIILKAFIIYIRERIFKCLPSLCLSILVGGGKIKLYRSNNVK